MQMSVGGIDTGVASTASRAENFNAPRSISHQQAMDQLRGNRSQGTQISSAGSLGAWPIRPLTTPDNPVVKGAITKALANRSVY